MGRLAVIVDLALHRMDRLLFRRGSVLEWRYNLAHYSVGIGDVKPGLSPYSRRTAPRDYTRMGMFAAVDDQEMAHVGWRVDNAMAGLTPRERAECVLALVQQNIRYSKDRSGEMCPDGRRDEWSFPVDTLADRKGDCEDSSFLCAYLMRYCGLDVQLCHMPGHITVAVRVPAEDGDITYGLDGGVYVRAETTGHSPLGRCRKRSLRMPPDVHNAPRYPDPAFLESIRSKRRW